MGKLMDKIDYALRIFREGKPVFIHDSGTRENEVDMVYYAGSITPKDITNLRKKAGGLICYSMPLEMGKEIGLKYMDEILKDAGYEEIAGKVLGYGDPPNFSLWVNHMDVVTGIRDSDRAKTIRELHSLVELVSKGRFSDAKNRFLKEFTSPGHVPILLGRGLEKRRGHTELSIAFAELAGLLPSTVIAEMLDGEGVMSLEDAGRIAMTFGSVVIEGDEILHAWFTRKGVDY